MVRFETDIRMNATQAGSAIENPALALTHEKSDALDIMFNVMGNVEAVVLDLDKVYLKGGKLPLTPEGHLDIEKLSVQSPLTIHILHQLNEFALEDGVPGITVTGKSGTAVLLADLQRKMLFEEASRRGMLEKPFIADPNSSGVAFSSEIIVRPEFLEPNTGRMYAIDKFGKPKKNKFVLDFFARDNGGTRDEYWPGGSHEVDQFPRAFYETFLRPDVLELLRESTRDSKTERQATIKPVFYNFPDTSQLEGRDLSELSEGELWELSVAKSIDFSLASTNHGAKFNLELGMTKILGNKELRTKWTTLLRSLTGNPTEQITDEASVRRTLELLFPKDVATVTLNFVDEEGSGMGKRVIIDLNPPGVNKLSGFLKIVKSMEAIYAKARLRAPNFFRRSIRLGDGPDKNDKQLLEFLGWTNTDRPHEKHLGFPVDSIQMLNMFGIQVKENETLEDTEHTYLFLRLIAFRRFGKLLDGIPEALRDKITIPNHLQSI